MSTPEPPKTILCTKCQDRQAPASTGVCITCCLSGGIFAQAQDENPFKKGKKP